MIKRVLNKMLLQLATSLVKESGNTASNDIEDMLLQMQLPIKLGIDLARSLANDQDDYDVLRGYLNVLVAMLAQIEKEVGKLEISRGLKTPPEPQKESADSDFIVPMPRFVKPVEQSTLSHKLKDFQR